MSTYLLALIVGEFDVIGLQTENGVRTQIYTPRGQAHLGKHALHVASLALPFFETQVSQLFILGV
jgi:aminopeptidase N